MPVLSFLYLFFFCCRFCLRFLYLSSFYFLFSSRRRHTRSKRDWSSDVCFFRSQLVETTSNVTGLSISVLLLSYLIRAIGDVLNDSISMISPLGWLTRTFAFSENNWWPLVLMFIVGIILIMITMYLYLDRDLESGLLPSKAGNKYAKKYWLSPIGMQIKLYKVGIISWAIGMFIFGASYGSVFGEMDDFISDNEMLKKMVAGSGDNYIESFLPTLMVIMAIVATIPAIMSLYKIKNEINMQRIENIFAKPVSRTYYFSGFIVISLINAVMMIFLASLGMYIAQASVLDNPFTFWTMIKSGIVYIPAIITFVSIGVLLIGWLNKGHFII